MQPQRSPPSAAIGKKAIEKKPLTATARLLLQRTNHMAKLNDFFPSRYFNADDFALHPAVFEISNIQVETFKQKDGTVADKPIAYFQGQRKSLILNKTNFKAIATIAGAQDTDEWPGTSIELYAAVVSVAGEETPCVRVRKPRAPKPAAAPAAPKGASPENDAPWAEEDIPDSWPDDPERG